MDMDFTQRPVTISTMNQNLVQGHYTSFTHEYSLICNMGNIWLRRDKMCNRQLISDLLNIARSLRDPSKQCPKET